MTLLATASVVQSIDNCKFYKDTLERFMSKYPVLLALLTLAFLAISCGNTNELTTVETPSQNLETIGSTQSKLAVPTATIDTAKSESAQDQDPVTNAHGNTTIAEIPGVESSDKSQSETSDAVKDTQTNTQVVETGKKQSVAADYSKINNKEQSTEQISNSESMESESNSAISDNQKADTVPDPKPTPTPLPVPTVTSVETPVPTPEWPKAPDFSLPSARGNQVELGSYVGQKNIILVFYRAYW